MSNGRDGIQLFRNQCDIGNQVCVGIDPRRKSLPPSLVSRSNEDSPLSHPLYLFGAYIGMAVEQIAGCVKINNAFFESWGWRGTRALEDLTNFYRERLLATPILGDCKRGDVGKTNIEHGKTQFDVFGFDGITINPWAGWEGGLDTLIGHYTNKLFFAWCRSSNPGARDFQDKNDQWKFTVETVAQKWNKFGNCGVVVGATYPNDLLWVRQNFPNLPILSPGLGLQGGKLIEAVTAGGTYTTYNNSRSIIHASTAADFDKHAAQTAQTMHDAIRTVRAS